MKIALVLCPFRDTLYPSLASALLASQLKRHGHSVRQIDVNRKMYRKCRKVFRSMWGLDHPFHADEYISKFIESNKTLIESFVEEILEFKPNMVGFTVYSNTRTISLEIARLLKTRNKELLVVFGGPECTLEGENIINYKCVDYVVKGEGDIALSELIEVIEGKRTIENCPGVWYKENASKKYTGERECLKDLDKLPFPDFSDIVGIFRNVSNLTFPIQASRGCVNRCAYCSDNFFWNKYRCMSSKRIFDEIVNGFLNYGIDRYTFHDSLINGNIKILEEFCDLMIRNKVNFAFSDNKNNFHKRKLKKISWSGQAAVRPEMKRPLLEKMRIAGCELLAYGIESGSQKVLSSINKHFLIRDAEKVIQETSNAGILCQINIMVGLPSETEDDFKQTLDFVKRVHPYVCSLLVNNSFCYISKESAIGRHPERYGVTNADNGLFWKSDNGTNNYKTRLYRYELLAKLALRLGLKEMPGLVLNRGDKYFLLEKYYRHEDNHIMADKCRIMFNSKSSDLRSLLNALNRG